MLPPFSQFLSQGAYPALDVSSLLKHFHLWENFSIMTGRNTKRVLIKTLANVEHMMLCPVSQEVKSTFSENNRPKAVICLHFTIPYIYYLTKVLLL